MTKLYVANVPLDATEDALRRHFSTCGGVSDVELVLDRQTGNPRGFARVTMTSPSYAEVACTKLDGAPFGEALLRVSDAPIRPDSPVKSKVKIMQQFRDRAQMAYDLDCAGTPLTLRISLVDDDDFCVEARSNDGAGAITGEGRAKTRVAALAEALRAWNDAATATHRGVVDGDAVARVMLDVRAI